MQETRYKGRTFYLRYALYYFPSMAYEWKQKDIFWKVLNLLWKKALVPWHD